MKITKMNNPKKITDLSGGLGGRPGLARLTYIPKLYVPIFSMMKLRIPATIIPVVQITRLKRL